MKNIAIMAEELPSTFEDGVSFDAQSDPFGNRGMV